jgi:hypothetical protein
MLELIAERKIVEALERGELSNLPGEGRPLVLDDDALVPEELRAAYRILKNAGYVPPEVEASHRDRAARESHSSGRRRLGGASKAVRKLALLRTKIENAYYEKALAKLGR